MFNPLHQLKKRLSTKACNSSEEKSKSLVKNDQFRLLDEWKLTDWLCYHQREIVFNKVSWMGIPTLKNVLDAWIYQEILFEVQPDIVIEIGSYTGGSTLYLAHLLEILNKGNVISIDIDRRLYKAKHERIIEITGDSSSQKVLDAVYQLCAGKRVFVIHDGDHHYDQVLKDLNSYAPLVSIGSYLIVEDGIVDVISPGNDLGWDEPGPLPAVEFFLKNHKNFTVDKDRERYLISYNPRGYLKRIY